MRSTGREYRILALDPGQRTGWAAETMDGALVSGSVRFKGDLDQRFHGFMEWLSLRMPRETLVCERPSGLKAWALDALYGQLGIARALAHQYSVRYEIVAPQAMKKAVTGYGRASKGEVKQAIEKRHGLRLKCSDEVDAIGILDCYRMTKRSSPSSEVPSASAPATSRSTSKGAARRKSGGRSPGSRKKVR